MYKCTGNCRLRRKPSILPSASRRKCKIRLGGTPNHGLNFQLLPICHHHSVCPFVMRISVNKERNGLVHTARLLQCEPWSFNTTNSCIGLMTVAERFAKCNMEFPFH